MLLWVDLWTSHQVGHNPVEARSKLFVVGQFRRNFRNGDSSLGQGVHPSPQEPRCLSFRFVYAYTEQVDNEFESGGHAHQSHTPELWASGQDENPIVGSRESARAPTPRASL